MSTSEPVLMCGCRDRMESARRLVEAEVAARDKALELYAKATDAHFSTLNNLYDKMARERDLFLFRAQHDAFFAEYRIFRDETRQAVIEWKTTKATLESITSQQMARWSFALLIISTAVSIAVAFVTHLMK